jgi:hypothetical protein
MTTVGCVWYSANNRFVGYVKALSQLQRLFSFEWIKMRCSLCVGNDLDRGSRVLFQHSVQAFVCTCSGWPVKGIEIRSQFLPTTRLEGWPFSEERGVGGR